MLYCNENRECAVREFERGRETERHREQVTSQSKRIKSMQQQWDGRTMVTYHG